MKADEVFHSEHIAFSVPSVIRLTHFVKVPFHAGTALSRRAVFLRDGGKCQYCPNNADSIDHVIPRSRGGAHAWDNVVAAWRSCNSRKRDRLLEETTFVLRRPPAPPRQKVWLLSHAAQADPQWLPYIGAEVLTA